jgi:hypothetical protein
MSYCKQVARAVKVAITQITKSSPLLRHLQVMIVGIRLLALSLLVSACAHSLPSDEPAIFEPPDPGFMLLH